MTVKTQYTGPFFLENEPHIFMEVQKSIFGPEEIFLDQKMFFGPENDLFGLEKSIFGPETYFSRPFSMVYIYIYRDLYIYHVYPWYIYIYHGYPWYI